MVGPFSKAENGDLHVLPEHDLREHEETRTCWCQPAIEEITDDIPWLGLPPKHLGTIVVHNSADGRELVEQHGIN